jgi:predicted DNA-binding transcriptional regulator AlpA
MQRLVDGKTDLPPAASAGTEDRLLTQKQAAEFLSVNRVTIYRLARDGFLHPVELLPGTLRYSFREIAELARHGAGTGRDLTPSGRAA